MRASQAIKLVRSDIQGRLAELHPDNWGDEPTELRALIMALAPFASLEKWDKTVDAIRRYLGPRIEGNDFYGLHVDPHLRQKRLFELAHVIAEFVPSLRRRRELLDFADSIAKVVALPGERLAKSASPRVELRWRGPFGLVNAAGLPLAMKQPVPYHYPGIHMWTVELPDGYLVNRIERTHPSFAASLAYSIQSRRLYPKHWAVARFAAGELMEIIPLKPAENVERILALYRIFMASVMTAAATPEQIVDCLVHQLLEYDVRCQKFLVTPRVHTPRQLNIIHKVRSSIRLIGLT
jgi:hypothetical protein